MKKAMLFFVLVFVVSSTFAQDLSMLRSKDALRVWALEQTVKVSASISTSLPSNDGNWAYVQVSEPTAEGIRNTIAGMNLSIDVANPEDSLFTWAGAYNADGDILFSGYRQFSLVKNTNGSYSLPSDYGYVALRMCDTIPIKIGDDAQYAMVALLNSDGQTIGQYSLEMRNGKVYIPQQLAGENAIFAKFSSETGWTYWDMSNGSKINSENFKINLKAGIVGISLYSDTNIDATIVTEYGIGQNLTVEYRATSDQFIGASFKTTEGKKSRGIFIKKSGTNEWNYYPYSGIGKYISLQLEQGVYYIIPDWNPRDLSEPEDPWTPPNYGQGVKG